MSKYPERNQSSSFVVVLWLLESQLTGELSGLLCTALCALALFIDFPLRLFIHELLNRHVALPISPFKDPPNLCSTSISMEMRGGKSKRADPPKCATVYEEETFKTYEWAVIDAPLLKVKFKWTWKIWKRIASSFLSGWLSLQFCA